MGMEIMPKLVSQSYLVVAPISALFLPPPPGNKGSACTVHRPHDQIKLGSTNYSHTIWVPACMKSQNYVAIFSHFLHHSKGAPESVLFDMTSFPSPIHPPKRQRMSCWKLLEHPSPPSPPPPPAIFDSFFGVRWCIELGMRKIIPTYTLIRCNFDALSQSMTRFLLF